MMISEEIKKQRKLKGFTQKELAEKSGLSISAIEKYEKGRRVPGVEALSKIGKALDTPLVGLQMALLRNKEDALINELFKHYIESFNLNVNLNELEGDPRVSDLKKNISRSMSEVLIEISKEN